MFWRFFAPIVNHWKKHGGCEMEKSMEHFDWLE